MNDSFCISWIRQHRTVCSFVALALAMCVVDRCRAIHAERVRRDLPFLRIPDTRKCYIPSQGMASMGLMRDLYSHAVDIHCKTSDSAVISAFISRDREYSKQWWLVLVVSNSTPTNSRYEFDDDGGSFGFRVQYSGPWYLPAFVLSAESPTTPLSEVESRYASSIRSIRLEPNASCVLIMDIHKLVCREELMPGKFLVRWDRFWGRWSFATKYEDLRDRDFAEFECVLLPRGDGSAHSLEVDSTDKVRKLKGSGRVADRGQTFK